MYNAWLDHGLRWVETKDSEEILNHDGRFIVCETKEESDKIEERIAEITGKYTRSLYGSISIMDIPASCDKDVRHRVLQGEKCRVQHAHYFTQSSVTRDGQLVEWHEGHKGFCAFKDPVEDGYVIIFDIALWTKCQRENEKYRRNNIENPHICAATLGSLAGSLAANMDMSPPQSFKVEQLLTWIYAHDQYHGRRKTNQKIKWVAKAWVKNLKTHRSRYKHILVLDKLEERFRAVAKFPD